MTTKQYWLLCALAGLCAVLAIEKYRVTKNLEEWQRRVNELQSTISGGLVNRLGPDAVKGVLVDMANMSATNAQLRKVLSDNNYTVNFNTPEQNSATNLTQGSSTNFAPSITTNSINFTTNPPSH
jgi:hypothetical protein